ncbi:MAG: hypothetical protein AB7Q00_16295 [Phycisphaerales bacterium]
MNYTLTHDAAGNLTDDGQNYKYVYGVFGRLVTVKNQSNNMVAKYAYDALGQRISTHTDVGGNGSVTTADHTYWFVYDDRWRIIATYRCEWDGGTSKYLPDSTHKEQFVWHAAGMDGHGDSSYIDCVMLRDRDSSAAWTAASSGSVAQRRFFGPNWRADVSLVMNTNGRPLERIKYSAYGTPITLTDIDYNNDTSLDPDDPGDFINAPYDWNLDGATDGSDNTDFAADYFTVAGNSYGRGVLSLAGIDNRIGYAGYIYDRFISGSDGGMWIVRNRVLNSGQGSWNTRDRVGYVDGPKLYELVRGRPLVVIDPSGLCARACPQPGPSSTQPSEYTSCPPGFRYDPQTDTCVIDDGPPPPPQSPRAPITIRCYRLPGVPGAAHCGIYNPNTKRICGAGPDLAPVPAGCIRGWCGPYDQSQESVMEESCDGPLGCYRSTPIDCPNEEAENRLFACMEANVRNLNRGCVSYSLLNGPNSNTTAHWLLNCCLQHAGCRAPAIDGGRDPAVPPGTVPGGWGQNMNRLPGCIVW